MPSRVSINDTQATIGEERLAMHNPLPPPSLTDYASLVAELSTMQGQMLAVMDTLQRRIEQLESRTWWSMLKAQLISLFGA